MQNKKCFISKLTLNIVKYSTKIINLIEKFSSLIPLTGYNSIDFKIYNNDIFILDVNPRITSTFKIYNDIYSNMLLTLQLSPKKNYKIMPIQKNNNLFLFSDPFSTKGITIKLIFSFWQSIINLFKIFIDLL